VFPLSKPFACIALALVASAALFTVRYATAQSYPARPIRLVVAFVPGGPNDVMARIVAQRLSINMGQQVIVDNRAGAGGLVGTDIVAKSVADGYTLLFASAPFAIAPSLYTKIPYDTEKDFVAVTKVASSPLVLTLQLGSPHKSLKELIDHAKTHPTKLKYGSGGVGSTPHFATAYLLSVVGAKMTHVPYKGGGQALTALMGAEVDLLMDSITSLLPFIESGKIRPLAVSQTKRSPKLPNVPTADEASVKGFSSTHWVGIVAPAKISNEILSQLNREIVKALASNEVRERLVAIGAEPVGDSPAQFQAFINVELKTYMKVAKEANIEPQ
jgi:tripartite-type tricarboxylate transporter receptor subunit TctC